MKGMQMRNGNLPSTTVSQSRVCLFQPTQRPVYRRGEWIETSWGRCRVTGRLGQRHADVFEAIFFYCEKSRLLADGRIELLVDPSIIRNSLSDRRYSGGGLHTLLTELSAAAVEIDTGGDWPAVGHLVDTHHRSATQKKIDPLTGEDRHLIVVKIGDAAMTLLNHDVPKWRDPAPLARLGNGISQAVARFLLSHQNTGQHWKMDTVLSAVGVGFGQSRWDRQRELLNSRDSLASVGIFVDDNHNFFVRILEQPPDSE
jgi:hypothetical protein